MTTTAFSHVEEELKNTYYLYFLTDFFIFSVINCLTENLHKKAIINVNNKTLFDQLFD